MLLDCWTKALMLVDPMDNCGQAGIPVSFSTDGPDTKLWLMQNGRYGSLKVGMLRSFTTILVELLRVKVNEGSTI